MVYFQVEQAIEWEDEYTFDTDTFTVFCVREQGVYLYYDTL